MNTPESAVSRIVNAVIARREGLTVRITDGEDEFHWGYFVGGAIKEFTFNSHETWGLRDTIRRFVESVPTEYVGLWLNEDTGRYHLDAAEWFGIQDYAERVAHERGELAIYDVARDESLLVSSPF